MDRWKKLWIMLGALYLRHSPIEVGRYRIITTLLPWLRALGSDMGKRTVHCRYGFRLNVDLGDWLGQYVYLTGAYERATSEVFLDLIKPGDTVLDLGANVGYFSLLCATLTGPTGRVLAFEPIPSVRANLMKNIALNQLQNIEVVPKAVLEAASNVTIFEGPDGHKGTSSLRPLSGSAKQLTIQSVALDSFAKELGRVKCIKIDVEGAEMRALMGMEVLVQRDHPAFVIEFTDAYLKSFGHSTQLMSDWLVTRGYRLYRITEDGLDGLDLSTQQALPQQYNVLAVSHLSSDLP